MTKKSDSKRKTSLETLVAGSGQRNLQIDKPDEFDAISPNSPKGRAILATAPIFNNAAVIESFQSNLMGKDVDLGTLINMLEMSVKSVANNDLAGIESMLVGQAAALQTVFSSLARKASVQQGLPQFQTYMGLALKAQAQSRATLAELLDIKRPRQPTFFGQNNLTTGPQQVNNVIQAAPQAEIAQNSPNQLSGGPSELRQDTRTQGITGKINSTLEALGKVYGPQDA